MRYLHRKTLFANFGFAASAFLAISQSYADQAHPSLANCTVLIIRHAEKPDMGPDLTPEGEARAKAYVEFFDHLKVEGHRWHATHLFAAADSKDSHRPRLTLSPLSLAMKMPLDTRFGSKDVKELAEDLESHRYGKDILICWRHGKIPALLSALGGDPTPLFPTGKWPGDTYDWMVEVPFDAHGQIRTGEVKLLREHLMPGDSKSP